MLQGRRAGLQIERTIKMPSKNQAILKKHRDNWYKKNKDKQISRQIERRNELKEWFWNYKRTLCCSICGMSFENRPECCDFHHRDKKEKNNGVGSKVLSSKKALFKEVEKCIPLCACCHRIEHKDMYLFS